MIFINPHKCCTFVTEKSCLTSNANLCIIQKLKLLPSHYLYWGETLVNRSFLAIRHILAEFYGKILPNGVEIFLKTEGSTFYFQSPAAIPLHLHDNGWCQKERPCGGTKIRAANENRNFTEVFGLHDYRILISEKWIQLRLTNVLGKWKSHTRMAQPSEKFRWKKSMACPCFLHRVFSKAVQPSMKVVVEVYINDFFLAVEYANKMVRQIKEWCFFWSVSLQPTKRSTFPHAVLLRHERVACHCFMSFGLCDKNGTASCGYKSQPLSARQTKKSPWQYSLEVFQGIPPRIFLAVP